MQTVNEGTKRVGGRRLQLLLISPEHAFEQIYCGKYHLNQHGAMRLRHLKSENVLHLVRDFTELAEAAGWCLWRWSRIRLHDGSPRAAVGAEAAGCAEESSLIAG